MQIIEILPNIEALLALQPEELGGVLLEHIIRTGREESFHVSHILNPIYPPISEYKESRERAKRAFEEAFSWLFTAGFIARSCEQPELYFVTRRGCELATADRIQTYRLSRSLPVDILHPMIRGVTEDLFLRGQYDTAVFESFKQVEISVREVGEFDQGAIGVSLMREAFRPTTGPLCARTGLGGEQQALMELFSGAIGSYKNPHSHRRVAIEAVEAIEMIVLASHLLKIVDSYRVSSP